MRLMKLLLLAGLIIFGVVWSLVVIPDLMTDTWWNSLDPVRQYLIFNIGMFLIISVMFGGFVTWILTQRLSLIQIFLNGVAGFFVFSFVFDMFMPPFAVSHAGVFQIATGTTMAGASVDYMVGWVWMQIGIHGSAVYYLTYAFTPVLAIIIAVLLLGLNRFTEIFAEAI